MNVYVRELTTALARAGVECDVYTRAWSDERLGAARIPQMGASFTGLKVSVFLEVEGAAHYLPAYAGNLDIMTSAALRTAEKIAAYARQGVAA